MATTHTSFPPASLRLTGATIRRARTTSVRREVSGLKSVSELDESHRRMKRNMQALAALLRLHAPDFGSPDPEALLTELETRLQTMATELRSRCRAGNFDQIELAVYLRQAARLWNSPPGYPLQGGWSFDSSGSLIWRPEAGARDAREPATATTDLERALESIPARWRESARRAVYSCAVTFPPWFFNWRSTDGGEKPGPQPASELRVRFRIAGDGVRVTVTLSGTGPGLPPNFGDAPRRALARDLVSSLDQLARADRSGETDSEVEFDVGFGGSGQRLACPAAA